MALLPETRSRTGRGRGGSNPPPAPNGPTSPPGGPTNPGPMKPPGQNVPAPGPMKPPPIPVGGRPGGRKPPLPPTNPGPMKPPGPNVPAPGPMKPQPGPVGKKPQADIRAKAAKQMAKGGGVAAANARRAKSGLPPLGNRVAAQIRKSQGKPAGTKTKTVTAGPLKVAKGKRRPPPSRAWDEGPMYPRPNSPASRK